MSKGQKTKKSDKKKPVTTLKEKRQAKKDKRDKKENPGVADA